MCLCLGSSSLICFDLCFRALNWYSSITFTAALLSMCASMSPILIRTVSWVLPHLSFFARCKTCRAVCSRYLQSDSLLASLSASVVFLTFSFRDSSLVSCLLSLVWSWSTARCIMIIFTTLQALLSLSWAVASRGIESCFPTVLAAYLGASFFFLVFLLAVFFRWGFLVRLSWVYLAPPLASLWDFSHCYFTLDIL